MNPKKNILIVDDEVSIAKVLGLKLESVGYAVKAVPNGSLALEEVANKNYDLILLDILMPGIDGWEVLNQLKGKKQKIVITSNLGQQEDINRAKELGALDFIVKSNSSLLEIVDKVAEYVR